MNDEVLTQLAPRCESLHSLKMAYGSLLRVSPSHTNITDDGFSSFIASCPNLRVLDIGNSSFLTDTSLLSLPQGRRLLVASRIATTHLHSLSVDNNKVTDRGIHAVLAQLPIRQLSVAFCSNITGSGWFRELRVDACFCLIEESELEEVNVMWCAKLTDDTFQRLQHCRKLVKVGISGCSISKPLQHLCEARGVIFF